MRTVQKMFWAGLAAVALAGSAGVALANGPALHTMTLHLPDGATAQIQYSGKVPPKVTFGTTPLMAGFYGPQSPFAMLDRIAADMNQEMSALMGQAGATAGPLWTPEPMFDMNLDKAPPGITQYSTVTTMSGDGHVCTRSMEITSTGKGRHPKVVSHTSGDCNAIAGATATGNPFASPGGRRQPTVEINTRQNDQAGMQSVQDAVFRSVR